MTQLEMARQGIVTPQMKAVAEREALDADSVRCGVADGSIVIPANPAHVTLKPCGIGRGLSTKVNANIGTSLDCASLEVELEKMRAVIEYKSDTAMDLSTGGDISAIRRAIIANCPLPLGTVPIYQAAIQAAGERGAIVNMTADDIFRVIEEQARDGVDFMTVHCGVTRTSIEHLRRQGRLTNVVSRGGAFLLGWILHNERENPLYEQYDRLLEIARDYDITLSLGDGMRPGSLSDATDRCQIQELLTLGELVERAWKAGVQVMVEGPGHVPLDQIVANVQLQKRICRGAPFYVLGPLVTDVGAGYDHISAAIGGAIAAAAGADFLCYVTPSEHLSLPDAAEVRDGIIGARIAAHAADIVKGVKGAAEWDRRMSLARRNLDWEEQIQLSMDPHKARRLHERFTDKGGTCSMCGPYCAMALVEKYLGISLAKCPR
ncbi:MAG: phosphomethylpyrimidine synthase ThiC [Dehalococcoidia bacterium]|nr:phosphomethylpyrimidine synthase ThiC [Dehalococcoidia bacterium]